MKNAPFIFSHFGEWLEKRKSLKLERQSIGFVPTMGALHEGHLSLLKKSHEQNDISVLSIYVNPTQFDNADDLNKYPSTLENDLNAAKGAGVDIVILPKYEEIYADKYRFKIKESGFSEKLCGAHRPGHFDGVLTVVMKLLNLVQPDRAYFGEKDYQQLQLIKDMAASFFLQTEIISMPTVREADGLAMSSRNTRLSPQARERAPQFYALMKSATSASEAQARLEQAGFEIDYIEDIGQRRFGAVRLEGVRLIDNVER